MNISFSNLASKFKHPEDEIRSCRDRISFPQRELLIPIIHKTASPFHLKVLSLEGKCSPAKVPSKQDTSLLIQPDSCVHEHVIAYRINHPH